MNLDDREQFRRIDTQDMLGHIDALPAQLASAWQHAHSSALPAGLAEVQRIVICGMGGSAISGSLLAALVEDTCRLPILVNREYNLPAFVTGPETLVIALSHSGSTEEVLSAVQQGVERGVRLLAITTGGDLAPLVEEAGGSTIIYQYNSQPRAALGWLYGLLLGACSRLGLIPDLLESVEETVSALDQNRQILDAGVPTVHNPAKRTAGQLVNRIPVIWGAGLLAPVAQRWKTQLNENAKTAAYAEPMPELNHNSVVGLEFPAVLNSNVAVVQLISEQHDHPRVAVRHRASYQLLMQSGVMADIVRARGSSRLCQQLGLIQFGDYLSYYVAMAYGVDPTPIANIDQLKQHLAQTG